MFSSPLAAAYRRKAPAGEHYRERRTRRRLHQESIRPLEHETNWKVQDLCLALAGALYRGGLRWVAPRQDASLAHQAAGRRGGRARRRADACGTARGNDPLDRRPDGEGGGCKRRSNNPSLKRPDFPVAPEQKSGSRYPFAVGRQRVGDEGRGALWARSLRGSDRGVEPSRGGATVWNRPSHGRQDDEVRGAAGLRADKAAG